MTLFENKATGFYGVMNGGELAGHGGYGSLNGTRYDRRIDVEGTFEIEGSRQVEDMAFVLHRDGTLSQGSGETIDQKGGKTVFKDPKNLTWDISYKEISCSGNKLLDVAREVYGKASAK